MVMLCDVEIVLNSLSSPRTHLVPTSDKVQRLKNQQFQSIKLGPELKFNLQLMERSLLLLNRSAIVSHVSHIS